MYHCYHEVGYYINNDEVCHNVQGRVIVMACRVWP